MFDEKRRRMLFSTTTTTTVHPASPRPSYQPGEGQTLLKTKTINASPLNSPRDLEEAPASPRAFNESAAPQSQLRGWRYVALVTVVFLVFTTLVELYDNYGLAPVTLPFYPLGTCMYFVKHPTAFGASYCPKGVCPSTGFTYPCAKNASPGDAGSHRTNELCVSLTNNGQPGIQPATNTEFCDAVCPYAMCGRGPMSTSRSTAILCLHHLEAIWFAVGLTFFFFGGYAVVYGMRKNSQLYWATIVLWLAVTYYILQHYPHYNLHKHWTTLDNWIQLDYCFHIPTALLSMFIGRYCYRLIAMSSSYKDPVSHADTWWQHILYHPWLKSIIAGTLVATVSFILLSKEIGLFTYTLIEWNHATAGQMTAIRILDVVHAIMAGVGWTFMFGVMPLIRQLTGVRYQIEASLFAFSVFVMIVNWQWHSVIHYATPIPYDPQLYVAFEFSIHFSMMLFTGIIAWYITLLIMMARSVTNKPRARRNTKHGTEASTTAAGQTIKSMASDQRIEVAG